MQGENAMATTPERAGDPDSASARVAPGSLELQDHDRDAVRLHALVLSALSDAVTGLARPGHRG